MNNFILWWIPSPWPSLRHWHIWRRRHHHRSMQRKIMVLRQLIRYLLSCTIMMMIMHIFPTRSTRHQCYQGSIILPVLLRLCETSLSISPTCINPFTYRCSVKISQDMMHQVCYNLWKLSTWIPCKTYWLVDMLCLMWNIAAIDIWLSGHPVYQIIFHKSYAPYPLICNGKTKYIYISFCRYISIYIYIYINNRYK